MRNIDLVVVHHSASSVQTSTEQIRAWHLARGWSDIGYHYVIEMEGGLVRGRPLELIGAHALGHNETSIGVCITGHNGGEHPWDAFQIEALRALASLLRAAWPGIPILGHRDVMPEHTACPGVDVQAIIEER